MKKLALIISFFLIFTVSPSFAGYEKLDEKACPVDKDAVNRVLQEVKNHNPDAISSLSKCLGLNHKLIFQACLIDPSQLAKALDIFREDENFVLRLLKAHPEILKYASPKLQEDQFFLQRATFIDRDALQYANPKVLNNILFMRKMIAIDSRNYMYASPRLKASKEHAAAAFKDNGMLLMYAPRIIRADKEMVKIAVLSNVLAFDFADKSLRKDKELLKIVGNRIENLHKRDFEKYLAETYLKKSADRNVGLTIDAEKTIYDKYRLINRNYISKWQRLSRVNGDKLQENLYLIDANVRNPEVRWREEFKDYPKLEKKIEAFLKNRQVDQNTIDNMMVTYLWKVSDNPMTLVFNIYLLRESNDIELGSDYVSITTLTGIAKHDENNNWKLTVVNVIFDSEVNASIAYENGHKQYVLQDLYFTHKQDKNPKLIFRVEDKFEEYFEIFAPQKGSKYQMIYRIHPTRIKEDVAPLEIESPEDSDDDYKHHCHLEREKFICFDDYLREPRNY